MFIQIELYNWLTYILTQEDIKNIKTGYGSCNLDVLHSCRASLIMYTFLYPKFKWKQFGFIDFDKIYL